MSKNNTIGVIQLGENKQVLETLLSFKGYTKSFPEIEKTIILKSSASNLNFLIKEEFENIIYLDCIDPTTIEPNFNSVREKIFSLSFSVLINLTFSKASAYLTSLIDSKFKLGFKYSTSNKLSIEDLWSKYIYGVVMGKNPNPFSIIDIYKSINGNKVGPSLSSIEKIDKIFINPSKKGGGKFKLKETLYQICLNFPEVEIFLIGEDFLENSILEDPLINNFKPRIQNLSGLISLEEFYHLTNNGGVYLGYFSLYSLICSYNNIQSIVLFNENEDINLHMPYGIANFSCQEDISPNELVNILIDNNDIPTLKTYLGKGHFLYNSFSKDQNLDINDIFLLFYKFAFAICFEDIEESINISYITEKTLADLNNYKNACNTLKELLAFGKKYSLSIIQELSNKNPSHLKLKEYGDRLDEIDLLSQKLKKSFPLLGPVIEFFTHSKGLYQGTDILDITQNIFLTFEEYSTFLDIILELINNINSRFTIIEKGN